jgi:hypothetical protein
MKSTMLTWINKRNVVSQFDRWIYENGVKISGMVNLDEQKERELFSKSNLQLQMLIVINDFERISICLTN